MALSPDMSPRKALASSKGGDFGVGGFPAAGAKSAALGITHEPLSDEQRSPAYKGMQGAPDHGPMGGDHHVRGGKA